jgi:uncharacterized membrane protein YqiK
MNLGAETLGLYPVLVVVGVIAFLLFGLLALVARFYRQVDQGRALVINTMRAEPVVAFTGAVVYPIINRAEVMDLSVKTIDIDRRGKEGLICNDNIRADINVTFFVRVNKTVEDVLKVAQSIGCARASDAKALEELFTAKFAEALKTVGKHFNFEELYLKRDDFKDKIIEVIGKDLNGFILDDAAIDYLEQTPLEHLDKDNIMDADGIRKITDLTVIQNVKTNELRQKERMEMGSQNLNADEALFRFEQRRAEAEAKKEKEISVAKSREENEALRVASDERKKTALITIKNDEESQVADQAKERGVAIAAKHKEREIAVEQERVEKARQLEVIGREREVSLGSIARDKEVEVQKKEIATVIRDRIAVEKTVAGEEELIKDVRTLAQANREKEVVRIGAEAAATEVTTKQVKAAQASEEVAKIKARERVVTAEAELDTADKLAKAKIRIAEGVQAEAAAEGLAKARVKEADAVASEKLGLTEAKISLEKLSAEAAGQEKQGLAKVRVREAEAAAVEKQGTAEASAIREKLTAEAQGLAQKAASMKALDESGRGHEEFRLNIEKERAIAMESLKVKKDIVAAQAQVMAEAMSKAKINIVGGDGQFFQRFVSAISLGQSVEGALEQSDTLRALVENIASNGDGNGAGNAVLAAALEKLAPQGPGKGPSGKRP